MRAGASEQGVHSVLLRIEVTDQGVGIGPEMQARLFHLFTQADDSLTGQYGGMGLGLRIAKRLAMLMGGDVGVVSQWDRGGTFWATDRLKRVAADQQFDVA